MKPKKKSSITVTTKVTDTVEIGVDDVIDCLRRCEVIPREGTVTVRVDKDYGNELDCLFITNVRETREEK